MPDGRAGLRSKTGRETGREGRMEEQGREVEAGSRTGVAASGWPAGGWPAVVGCFGVVFGRFPVGRPAVGLRWSAASGWCSVGFPVGRPAVRPPVRAKRAPAGTTARRGAVFHVKRMDGGKMVGRWPPILCHAGQTPYRRRSSSLSFSSFSSSSQSNQGKSRRPPSEKRV